MNDKRSLKNHSAWCGHCLPQNNVVFVCPDQVLNNDMTNERWTSVTAERAATLTGQTAYNPSFKLITKQFKHFVRLNYACFMVVVFGHFFSVCNFRMDRTCFFLIHFIELFYILTGQTCVYIYVMCMCVVSNISPFSFSWQTVYIDSIIISYIFGWHAFHVSCMLVLVLDMSMCVWPLLSFHVAMCLYGSSQPSSFFMCIPSIKPFSIPCM